MKAPHGLQRKKPSKVTWQKAASAALGKAELASSTRQRAVKKRNNIITWREEAHQQHRLERVSVQPLADAHAPEQLPRRHAVVPRNFGRQVKGGCRTLDDRMRNSSRAAMRSNLQAGQSVPWMVSSQSAAELMQTSQRQGAVLPKQALCKPAALKAFQ